jgi:beta-galactosidase
VGLQRPWLAPELTALHRLPMHSVPHADRVELDGTWRFQLLDAPDAEPGANWTEIAVPGCWTMQGFDDRPQYTNVQMPFAGLPPDVPEHNPTGLYEREFEVPAGWAERRIILHVGAAESLLIVRVNGADVGLSKDSHLAAEFDVTDLVRPGGNTLTLRIVKWSDATYIEDQDQWWHGGITRSVFLYATGPVHLADIKAIASLADDLRTGTLSLDVRVGFARVEPGPGWRVEAALAAGPDLELDLQAEAPASSALEWFWKGPEADLMFRHVVGGDEAVREQADDWAKLSTRLQPPREGSVSWQVDVPDVGPWSAELPRLYPLRIRLIEPSGDVAEEVELQIGFRRVEIRGLDLLINGRRVPIRGVNRHDFDQLQRGADVPLSQRPRIARPGRRARAVRHRRGGHRIACIPEHAVRRPALPGRVGHARVEDGRARQESPLGDRLVARQRVWPRHEPRGGGGLGSAL